MSEFNKINATIPIVATTAALARAFGIRALQASPYARDADDAQKSQAYQKDKAQAGYKEPDAKLYDSILGTPVYADVTLEGGTYTDNITGKAVTFPTLRFDSVILTVDIAARIVKTEIQGRNGTVKEYIGEDDAAVSIQGVIVGHNGHYPALEVSRLNDWRRAPVAKAVTSTFLQNLGIANLVVEDCSLPQIAGGYSYQTFTINCISDLPVELKITSA
jgi:hypothetical protein